MSNEEPREAPPDQGEPEAPAPVYRNGATPPSAGELNGNGAANGADTELPTEPPAPPRPPKPPYLYVGDDIPSALAFLGGKKIWVPWGYFWTRKNQTKWQKVLCRVDNGRFGGVDQPETWGTFAEALDTQRRYLLAGVGLVLTGKDGIVGGDLDSCITDSGSLTELAARVVEYNETYCEISPSGEGLRFIWLGELAEALKADAIGVEAYGSDRFLTITGNRLPDAPNEVREAPQTLAAMREAVVAEQARKDAEKAAERAEKAEKAKAKSGEAKTLKNGKSTDEFFRRVNQAAMDAIEAGVWVQALHPEAERSANGAWRVSSADLGRDLEEDVSYFREGIRDFGLEDTLTPIDAVLRFGGSLGLTEAKYAAFWLCEQLGIAPKDLGWKEPKEEAKASQATVLINLIESEKVELFNTPDGQAFADIFIGGHRETYAANSRGFRNWWRHVYFLETGGAPSTDAMSTAAGVIDARAQFDGETHEVFLRVASTKNEEGAEVIYIDRGGPDWDVIEIDAEGFRLVTAPVESVRFRRTRGMQALPRPLQGGTISDLRKHLNLTDEGFVMTTGWMLSALRGKGPFPVLVMGGEHGTGKSTATDRLTRLIDPRTAALRGLPRDTRDLAIAAGNTYVLAFDNTSSISAEVADAICRLSTGGGFATRALYTDGDEHVFDGKRPIILNSIADIATRGDLADRSVGATLERISQKARKTDDAVLAEFERSAPYILGALLDAVARGLKELPGVNMPKLPRMADHALWVRACEPGINTQVGKNDWKVGLHLEVYEQNRDAANDIVLEGDRVAEAIGTYMLNNSEARLTMSRLLEILTDLVPLADRRAMRDWPTNAISLGNRMRRLAPALRGGGISVEFIKSGKAKTRLVVLKKQPPEPETADDPSQE